MFGGCLYCYINVNSLVAFLYSLATCKTCNSCDSFNAFSYLSFLVTGLCLKAVTTEKISLFISEPALLEKDWIPFHYSVWDFAHGK